MADTSGTSDWVKVDGLAEWFGCSPKTMRRKLPSLYALGFPHPNPAIGKWYVPACKNWAGESSTIPTPKSDPFVRALDDIRRH